MILANMSRLQTVQLLREVVASHEVADAREAHRSAGVAIQEKREELVIQIAAAKLQVSLAWNNLMTDMVRSGDLDAVRDTERATRDTLSRLRGELALLENAAQSALEQMECAQAEQKAVKRKGETRAAASARLTEEESKRQTRLEDLLGEIEMANPGGWSGSTDV